MRGIVLISVTVLVVAVLCLHSAESKKDERHCDREMKETCKKSGKVCVPGRKGQDESAQCRTKCHKKTKPCPTGEACMMKHKTRVCMPAKETEGPAAATAEPTTTTAEPTTTTPEPTTTTPEATTTTAEPTTTTAEPTTTTT